MAYSTPAMVRRMLNPFGPDDGSRPTLAAKSNTAADFDDALLQDAIDEADALIDARLAVVYTTPVANAAGVVPPVVAHWSRVIAAYLATLTYRKGQDLPQANPVALRYAMVMEALKSAGAGNLHLDAVAASSELEREGAGSPVNPYDGDLFTPGDFGLTTADTTVNLPYWTPRSW